MTTFSTQTLQKKGISWEILPERTLFGSYSRFAVPIPAKHPVYSIYAVKLKTGPRFALFKVKNWSIFFVFFVFLFSKISFSLQKEEDFWKTSQKKQQKKTQFLKLKTGPIMLRNILGPVFNFNLDQFLTLEFCYFFCFFFWFFFGLKPLFL